MILINSMTKLIIFDFNRTLYDPGSRQLLPDTIGVLKKLKAQGRELRLLSRAKPGRLKLITALGLKKIFKSIHLVEKKSPLKLQEISRQSGCELKDCTIVGDRIKQEIVFGKQLGMRTVWLRNGKFATELPTTSAEEPDEKITSLEDLLQLL